MMMFPKPRPAALERKDRRRQLVKADLSENAKVKARSGGRCEMTMRGSFGVYCCQRRAVHVHHLIGGIGVRGRGDSAKAENKLHLCDRCHSDIHAHVLVPDGKQFRRVK